MTIFAALSDAVRFAASILSLCLPFWLTFGLSWFRKVPDVVLWLLVAGCLGMVAACWEDGFLWEVGAWFLGAFAALGAFGIAVGAYYRRLMRKGPALLRKYWFPALFCAPPLLISLLTGWSRTPLSQFSHVVTKLFILLLSFLPFFFLAAVVAAICGTLHEHSRRKKTASPAPPEKESP